MSVRSTVKTIILHDGKVLLNRCRSPHIGEYYSMPGGGQEQYETMEEAIYRECLEETGYSVEPVRFCALMEEICLDPFIRENYSQYAHKMLHIFVCRLTSMERKEPTETDEAQLATEWIPVSDVPKINLLPKEVCSAFEQLMECDKPLFLGSSYLEYNHG
jgi:ADP-ribose pyrophosphatase YjhB (NUDIX family)